MGSSNSKKERKKEREVVVTCMLMCPSRREVKERGSPGRGWNV